MNTTNYTPMTGLTWKKVFALQSDIMIAYEPAFMFKLSGGSDINTLEDQEIAKKIIGRITEELCEANEARDILLEDHDPRLEKQLSNHVVEEVVDAFNFYLELLLFLGREIDTGSFKVGLLPGGKAFPWHEVVYTLGLASNHLKNREWRSSQYLVDLVPFYREIDRAARWFGELFSVMGLHSEEQVFEAWSLKYRVNKFRLETNY